jgi:serine O-acetyltransferase
MHLNLIEPAEESTLEESTILISATVPDWARETPRQFWDPGRKLLATIRAYEKCNRKTGLTARILCKILVIRHRFWSVVTGADIPLNCQIGGGLLIPHPNGIVIHPESVIGVNCLIFQQVTIGSRSGAGLPVIGGHVDIGAGAKILGNVRIGDHARIGANAVVTKSVAPQGTAIGTN